MRAGAGLGFSITSSSDAYYWSEFFFQWVFYFTIILIMLNIINGIIVDTFQDMRKQNEINETKKDNTCYICSLSKSNLESHGIKFKEHCHKHHNLFSYLQYISKMKSLIDDGSLNSAELMVIQKLKNGIYNFIPSKKAIALED